MKTSRTASAIRWPLVIALGAFALVRPVMNIFGVMDDVKPVGPLVVTLVISVAWISVVVIIRDPRPLLTLVLAGLAYAVLAIALSGIVSPIKDGHLEGPLANPIAIVPVLCVNALWGLITGLVAETVISRGGRSVRSP